MALTVFDCAGIPASHRHQIQTAVESAGRHLSEPYGAWISKEPSIGTVSVLILGPNSFERTVAFGPDEDLATIKERVRQTVGSNDIDPIDDFFRWEAWRWKSLRPEWRYSGIAGLLLEHGRRFTRGDPPPRTEGWSNIPRYCFRNAYWNVLCDPERFVYCEGYRWRAGRNYAMHHAWFVERRKPEIAFDTTPERVGDECRYYGIHLSFAYVCRKLSVAKSLSVLLPPEPWPIAGPPIFAGVDPPESFLAAPWKEAEPPTVQPHPESDGR